MNHLTENILTSGNMNISAITKGIVLPQFTYEIVTTRNIVKGSDGSLFYEDLYRIRRERERLRQSGDTSYDIQEIKVYVDWTKENKKDDKKIYASLIEKKITAELITRFNESYKITVTLLDK